MELRSERHVARVPEHDLERRQIERRTCEVGQAVAAARVRPMPLGDCQHAGDASPDSVRYELRGVGLGEDPHYERFDELPVGQTGVELAKRP